MTDQGVPSTYRCLPFPRLEDRGFSLRAVQQSDIEPIRQWRNAQIGVLRQAEPISEDAQNAYFAREIWPTLDKAQPRNILLAFSEGYRLIGYGGLVHVAWEHRRAEVSFLLEPEMERDRDAFSACFATYLGMIKELAFRGLGFHRLVTETFDIRPAVVAALEQAGFRLEGRMRDHVMIDGTPTDSLIHGCLDND